MNKYGAGEWGDGGDGDGGGGGGVKERRGCDDLRGGLEGSVGAKFEEI